MGPEYKDVPLPFDAHAEFERERPICPTCSGSGMVLYNAGPNQAGEMCPDCAPGPFVELICGDVLDILRDMETASVHMACTSPPYYKLRDYGVPPTSWADGTSVSLGLEPSTDAFIAHLVEVFRELRRVLRPNGNFWLNIADSFAGPGVHREPIKYAACDSQKPVRTRRKGLSSKSLLLVPEQLVVALRNDGWIVRQVNIWHKPNPMCSSAKDRTTSAFEYVYHLVQQDHYYYNADAIAEPIAKSSAKRYQHVLDHNEQYDPAKHKHGVGINPSPMEVLTRGAAGIMRKGTRNKRNVWTIPTQPFRGAHFACWPERLCEIMIKAGCPEGGIVCDPFAGSGRTGVVAKRLGRSFIGIDVKPEYIDMAEKAIRGVIYGTDTQQQVGIQQQDRKAVRAGQSQAGAEDTNDKGLVSRDV